jgi:hypothetical protein
MALEKVRIKNGVEQAGGLDEWMLPDGSVAYPFEPRSLVARRTFRRQLVEDLELPKRVIAGLERLDILTVGDLLLALKQPAPQMLPTIRSERARLLRALDALAATLAPALDSAEGAETQPSLEGGLTAGADILRSMRALLLENPGKVFLDQDLVAFNLREGLGGEPPQTLEDVGRIMGVTRERIRQRTSRVLHIFRGIFGLEPLPQGIRSMDFESWTGMGRELSAPVGSAGILPESALVRHAAQRLGRPLEPEDRAMLKILLEAHAIEFADLALPLPNGGSCRVWFDPGAWSGPEVRDTLGRLRDTLRSVSQWIPLSQLIPLLPKNRRGEGAVETLRALLRVIETVEWTDDEEQARLRLPYLRNRSLRLRRILEDQGGGGPLHLREIVGALNRARAREGLLPVPHPPRSLVTTLVTSPDFINGGRTGLWQLRDLRPRG